jgi:type IV fimbrial biogenesis protein FimT
LLEILMLDSPIMTRQQGFTLVELLVTITVAAILLAIAIPSFLDMMDKRRLVGAADNLLADMRFAQAEAMKSNVAVVVSGLPTSDTANWSYSVGANSRSGADYKGTLMIASNATITFSPKRNTIEPASGTVTITSARGKKLRLQVTGGSALRLCAPTGLSGYPNC